MKNIWTQIVTLSSKPMNFKVIILSIKGNNGQQRAIGAYFRTKTNTCKKDKRTHPERVRQGALALLRRNNVCFRSVFSLCCGPRVPLSAAGQSRWRAWCVGQRSTAGWAGLWRGGLIKGGGAPGGWGVPFPEGVSQGVKTSWKLK